MTKPSKITVGILQFAPKLGDIQANIKKLDSILNAHSGIDLWVLPELASSGYNFSSEAQAFNSSESLHRSLFVQFLTQKAKELNTLIVSGINEREGTRLFNSSVLVGPEGIVTHYRKIHLFNREKLFFEPGNLEFQVANTAYGKIGMLICFDWMFPEVWRILSLQGAQIICHPSNLVLPWCQTAIPGYSLTNRIFIATTNRVGMEGDLRFTGQSVLVNPNGEYLLKGSETAEEVLTYQIDLSEALNKQMTDRNDAFQDRNNQKYSLDEIPVDLPVEKKILRKEIKKIKAQHTEEELKVIGQKVFAQLEESADFKNAKTILAYWSLPDEVPTHEFIEKWRCEKRFLLPRVVGDHLEIRQYNGVESLETGPSFGIKEPTGPIFTDLEEIDLVLVPGMAFSPAGKRLGRGGGYYDRTLPFLFNAKKIGLAFPFQIMFHIPCGEQDMSVDAVVTGQQ